MSARLGALGRTPPGGAPAAHAAQTSATHTGSAAVKCGRRKRSLGGGAVFRISGPHTACGDRRESGFVSALTPVPQRHEGAGASAPRDNQIGMGQELTQHRTSAWDERHLEPEVELGLRHTGTLASDHEALPLGLDLIYLDLPQGVVLCGGAIHAT